MNCMPAVANSMVYFSSNDGFIYALDASTGTQRSQFAAGTVGASSPAVANGVVYAGSRNGLVYALNT